ncbi:MAG: ABC transporter substrate-binding protein [Nitrospira sp.]|nr:ABC transporter substrate-binding protein [Nitrospira sp.]
MTVSLCLLASLPGVEWCACPSAAQAQSTRIVRDAAGRAVAVPVPVARVATLGPVPVLNSFILALGKGEAIVNGLPLFARSPRHKYQTIFAPTLAERPVIQGPGREPDLEVLLTLRPDVVLTMDRGMAESLERKGFAVLVLAWRNPEDVAATMLLLGTVFDREREARDYLDYTGRLLARVGDAVADVPDSRRPTVLFCSLKTMTQPHLIADWWIRQAGGISVTENGRHLESVLFSMEHVLKWNPDILIVSAPGEIDQVYRDTRMRTVKAVVNRQVYSIPAGAHPWGYRTVEQPLTVLWAFALMHPDKAGGLNVKAEMKTFYGRFFQYSLTDAQVEDMLSGIP